MRGRPREPQKCQHRTLISFQVVPEQPLSPRVLVELVKSVIVRPLLLGYFCDFKPTYSDVVAKGVLGDDLSTFVFKA